ncbi:hypothetical protein MIND_00386900 [Mycena indigotica]|uniref:BTB domain-containing protein n=1 Tax=Mycena indigotica TaxID=2126181 RepID=A0A8H6T658_9AGAR|nr:uncharacterized protein MIND_00386900 [Mycena indigotica]KAF7310135.1 hypothetical protein MIND_00386900 [Mycena indigotica]
MSGPVPIVDAAHPFARDSDELNPPDIIMRSADRVDFFAHKQMLAFSSNCFANMFAFPAPTVDDANPTRAGLTVVVVPEPAVALRVLLLMSYPRFSATYIVDSFDGVAEAYAAAKKYDIPAAITHIPKLLLEPVLLAREPYRVFAIAHILQLEDIAKAAAAETLKHPILGPAAHVPEYALISAHQLWQLHAFRREVADVLKGIVELFVRPCLAENLVIYDDAFTPERAHLTLVWWSPMGPRGKHAVGCGASLLAVPEDFPEVLVVPAPWFSEHIDRVMQRVSSLYTPFETNVDHVAEFLGQITPEIITATSKCPLCTAKAATDLKELADGFRVVAKGSIEHVLQKTTFITL